MFVTDSSRLHDRDTIHGPYTTEVLWADYPFSVFLLVYVSHTNISLPLSRHLTTPLHLQNVFSVEPDHRRSVYTLAPPYPSPVPSTWFPDHSGLEPVSHRPFLHPSHFPLLRFLIYTRSLTYSPKGLRYGS